MSAVITPQAYALAFAREQMMLYPMVDAIEQDCGYALERARYEPAAAILACPVKVNPPNWQHGRVLYALTRHYLAGGTEPVSLLDIGTAKGYSALCLHWALVDSGRPGRVTSVDVIEPHGRVQRNTSADIEGKKTLYEILAPFPEHEGITFLQSTGVDWLQKHPDRVHVAFVDGKHDAFVVRAEGRLLAKRQQAGDLVVFDDVHIGDIHAAVMTLNDRYRIRYVEVLPNRAYAIATRR